MAITIKVLAIKVHRYLIITATGAVLLWFSGLLVVVKPLLAYDALP